MKSWALYALVASIDKWGNADSELNERKQIVLQLGMRLEPYLRYVVDPWMYLRLCMWRGRCARGRPDRQKSGRTQLLWGPPAPGLAALSQRPPHSRVRATSPSLFRAPSYAVRRQYPQCSSTLLDKVCHLVNLSGFLNNCVVFARDFGASTTR